MTVSDNPKRLTSEDVLCIRTYADCNMRASEAARQLGYAPNNVDYHLKKIQKYTGYNPKVFNDLVYLVSWLDENWTDQT